jgi:hypothetical protein
MAVQEKNMAGFSAANKELSWENESVTLLRIVEEAIRK